MRRTITILVALGALLYLGAAVAGTDDLPPPAGTASTTIDATAVPEPAPPAAAGLTLELSSPTPAYGERVEARGSLQPMSPGEQVVLEIDLGDGVWSPMAQGPVDGFGSYVLSFDALAAGTLRARATVGGATSATVPFAVAPVVRVTTKPGTAFRTALLRAAIAPSTYSGRVTAVVRRDGKRVARAAGRARNGRLRLEVPTPGVGTFWVELSLPAASGLAGRTVGAKVTARGRTLEAGSTGRDVVALRARLAALRFHVPWPSTTFGWELYDSVIAFQKAYGLSRTGIVDQATWRKLDSAAVLKPRYRGPSPHIEVDKTRQILLVVQQGEVAAILPVSTGATGNTPEGRHAIRWKAPATTTWLGSGILYRTLTFVGNSFAIHGWSSVPAYPASHGCVRIPIWTADWLYNQSPVGETVYVYR
jgi:lipoprotein-anchoring transpeptidase ErfK/SrfK